MMGMCDTSLRAFRWSMSYMTSDISENVIFMSYYGTLPNIVKPFDTLSQRVETSTTDPSHDHERDETRTKKTLVQPHRECRV